MVSRTVSGARYGVRDWLVQRVSALYMALYTLFMLALLLNQPLSFSRWQDLFQSSPMRYATLLFALSLFWHAWIGVRDICMDYLRNTGIRLLAEALSILALVAYSGWTIHILWGGA